MNDEKHNNIPDTLLYYWFYNMAFIFSGESHRSIVAAVLKEVYLYTINIIV